MIPRIYLPLLLATLALGAAAPNDPVVAERGNVTLTASQLKAALATQTAAMRARLAADPNSLGNFVQSVLIGRVLLAEAEAAKWDQTPAVQAALARAHDTVMVETYLADQVKPAADYPTEDEVKAAYQQNQAKLMQPRRYHLEQILIGVAAGADKATDNVAHTRALAVRAQAAKPKADFEALAAALSTDRTVAAARGDMGWVPENQLLPAIKSAVAGLAVGGVSAPVRTDGGWHILKLVDTKAAGPAALAEVHDQLVQALRQQKSQQGEQQYLNGLIKAQPIELNAIAIGAVIGNGS